MMKIGLLIIGVGLASSAFADGQSFNCYANGEVVLVAFVDEDGESGTIRVAGKEFEASYVVEGINRRWDWDLNEENIYRYTFVIALGGIGVYKDHSIPESVDGGWQYFKCATD